MKLSKEQKRKANELLYALKKIKDKNQLREVADRTIPNDQNAIPVLQGFIELLKNALDNDRIDNEECRKSLNASIVVLQSIVQDGQITKDERVKILDALVRLHEIQKDLRKIEAYKTAGIAGGLLAIITFILIVVAGGNKAQAQNNH